MPEKNSKK